jgi:putative tryptophan/tyrosine transport system substrate-binding protein
VNRRGFMTLLGGAAGWPFAARAQQGERVRRIGVLLNLSDSDPEGRLRVEAFRQSLENHGWTEGRNIRIEYRRTGSSPERAREYAAELVAMEPEVIFAAPTMVVAALQRETRTVPIVFAQVNDPVAAGFVSSLARPGGNMTGFALLEFATGAKWVELLKQMSPSVTRAIVLYDTGNPDSPGFLPMILAAGRSYGVDISPAAVRNAAEVERAIVDFAREPNSGLIPIPSPAPVEHRDLVISLATRLRVPNVYAYGYYPRTGGLASYGPDNIDGYRQAASYVDRILKGEKPADLPVQTPVKFELVVNLKAAKALGLTVPTSLLVAADEVIE